MNEWRDLIELAVKDEMVPLGCIEIHDADGVLLARQWIGTSEKVPDAEPDA